MVSNADMARNYRTVIDLEIAQKKLDIKRLRRAMRQVDLTERLFELSDEKHRTDYEIEAARLQRNLVAVELDIANIDLQIAKLRTEQKLIEETISEDMVNSLFDGLIPVVISGPHTIADLLVETVAQKGGGATTSFADRLATATQDGAFGKIPSRGPFGGIYPGEASFGRG